MYKFEIHLHSCECSACGSSTSKEMLDAAKENGYAGVVFTNHFYHGNTAIDPKLPWTEFVKFYAEDFYNAKHYGESIGLKVFFGIEEVYAPGKEMLIYGLSPELIAEHPEFKNMSPIEITEFVHSHGGLTVCAHPFRDRIYIPNPDTPPDIALFDGIECFNLFNKPEENEKAFLFAEKTSLFQTSGGDVHNAKNFGKTGIAFNEAINSYEEFIDKMRAGNFILLFPTDV